jgi:hypothetical protein
MSSLPFACRLRKGDAVTKDLPKRHHWWPQSVSQFWLNSTGGINRLTPDGMVKSLTPINTGVIGNGHYIKLGKPGEATPWDENFESEFATADENFPRIIAWLNGLDRREAPLEISRRRRTIEQAITDLQMAEVIECLVSLAVRSPMHREKAVVLPEELRGALPERERNVLIGSNVRHSHQRTIRALQGGGKLMVIYSPEREFIFGDGFFNNITPPCDIITNAKIVVPLTPWMTAIYARPRSYRIDPRLVTLTATGAEVDILNGAIQIHARRQIFYRSERPKISEAFRKEEHLIFRDDRNSVDDFIYGMPGVDPRDDTMDFFRDLYG